ncbi:hypothetical protein [Nonomuraea recticatena]|uniref:Tail fiber protein n=1 Tax=Nonomuraea recticatena TaxID=46178 RepID=A0ABN3S0P8_9ACTN
MVQRSFPFDGGSGAVITEADWSYLAEAWQDSGVVADGPPSMALKVTSLNEAGKVYVEPGQAKIRGFHYVNDAKLPVSVPPNDNVSQSRKDIVVLRLNLATNEILAVYKTGTPAATPVPPSVDRTPTSYEVLLATITMAPSATSVPNNAPQLVDSREYIGKRIRVSGSGVELPVGSIFYNPLDGKFYGKNATDVKELGSGGSTPQPTTMPYALLSTTASNSYNVTQSLTTIKTERVHAAVGISTVDAFGGSKEIKIDTSGTYFCAVNMWGVCSNTGSLRFVWGGNPTIIAVATASSSASTFGLTTSGLTELVAGQELEPVLYWHGAGSVSVTINAGSSLSIFKVA